MFYIDSEQKEKLKKTKRIYKKNYVKALHSSFRQKTPIDKVWYPKAFFACNNVA